MRAARSEGELDAGAMRATASRIDHHTGRVSTWRPGVADQCGEPVCHEAPPPMKAMARCMPVSRVRAARASERRRSRHHLATARGLQSAGRLQLSAELSAG
jgi:hypothetical protein